MEFRILGPLEVSAAGRPVALGGPKQRALLAILLLHLNEVVPADRLIDELWGDNPPGSAAKGLQGYVSGLRKALLQGGRADSGGVVLVTRTPGYAIEMSTEQLDAVQFERLLTEARSAAGVGDQAGAAALFRRALALWRGPPLADFAYASFAQTEIDRLQELWAGAVEGRIHADLAVGNHAAAVAELEVLIEHYPLRERLRGELMLALYRSGRQAEALKVYADTRRVLVDELGIDPGRDLKELERAILNHDPSLDLAPLERGHDTSAAIGVLIGRDSELKALIAGFGAAVGGRGQLFLLAGEPGIGKTRLAEEVGRVARERGADVLLGRCWEGGGAPAYWPWVQLLQRFVEHTPPGALHELLAAGGAELAQLVPELRDLFADLPAPHPDTEGARVRLFDSATRFLRNAAARRPLVLVLDDLHAADEPSLMMLRFLARELANSRLLVVGTYRNVDPTVRAGLGSTLAELAREPVTYRIELTGLSEPDVGRFIELGSGVSASEQMVAAIHTETDGNPFFVGEVVRLLAGEGRLGDVDARALGNLGIPQGVREVISRRLGRLSGECQNVLSLASVLGRELDLDALERLSGVHGDELLEVLDEAAGARVLGATPGNPARLRFAHALIRQTLYDQLTPPRRAQLHRRAGEALEALYAHDPQPYLAELAYHFVEAALAGDVDKARMYAQSAGDRALALLAYEEAARLYRLGLQALARRQSVDPVTHCQLLLQLGEALARAGDTPDAKTSFVAAAEVARSAGLSRQVARAALGYGGRFPWLRAGDDHRLVPLLEEGLAALGTEESTLRVRLMARLAGALRDQPSLEPRSSLSRAAVELARRLGDPDALAFALASLFTATMGPDIVALMAIADEATQLAKKAADPERALDACWLQRIALFSLGETDRVVAVAEEHRALADELKQPSQQWYDAVMRSTWALFRGEFTEGEQLAKEALRLGLHAQSWDAECSYRLALFILRREQGRLAEIHDLIRRSLHEYPGYRLFPCVLALLECELRCEDDARERFETLAAQDFAAFPRDGEWLFCLCVLAEVAASLGDRRRSALLFELLVPYGRLNTLASGEVAIGSVARYLGILATTMTSWADAERHFEEAVRANERMGARPWVAHTQHDYADMLLSRAAPDDTYRARILLSQAHATYGELDMARTDRCRE